MLIVVLLAVVSQAETFFGVERLDAEGAQEVATDTETQTSKAGSKFENQPGELTDRHPLGRRDHPVPAIPLGSRQRAGPGHRRPRASSLLGLIALSWRQVLALPKTMMRNPYVLYCFMFTLAFIVAFSSFNNFGLLVRQRAQMFPFFLVLLTPLRPPFRPGTERHRG